MSSSLARYESFLIKNVSTLSTLESSLRSVTWFLPGRFKDAELASEILTSLVNVMSMYHDTLLAKISTSKPLIPPSLHTRFTRAWSDKSFVYKWAARALELIRFTELVIEMGLRRKVSNKNRWRGIILLETLKATIRLVLLRVTNRPLVSPPIPEREIDPSIITPPSNTSSPTIAATPSPPSTPDHLKNNHVPLPPLHPLLALPPSALSDKTIEDYLLPKALATSSVKPSLSLIRTLAVPLDWISEVLYIARPLIYVTLLSSGRKSNRPLVVALLLELLSRNLRRKPPPSASLERAEYARRDRDLLWYLLRGSVWESFTRPKLESITLKTAHVPIIGLAGSLLKEWFPLIDEYHYYTAP